MNTGHSRSIAATVDITLGLIGLSPNPALAQATPAAGAQTTATALPQHADDALKPTRAGMGEDVILAQLRFAATEPLSPEQMIYLGKAGVSVNAIKALMVEGRVEPAHAPALLPSDSVAPAAPAYPPAAPTPEFLSAAKAASNKPNS